MIGDGGHLVLMQPQIRGYANPPCEMHAEKSFQMPLSDSTSSEATRRRASGQVSSARRPAGGPIAETRYWCAVTGAVLCRPLHDFLPLQLGAARYLNRFQVRKIIMVAAHPSFLPPLVQRHDCALTKALVAPSIINLNAVVFTGREAS